MAKAEYRSSLRSKKLITDALVELLDEKTLDKITVIGLSVSFQFLLMN